MFKFLRKSGTWALSIITVIFMVVPESTFGKYKLFLFLSDDINIVLTRVLVFLVVLFCPLE